LTTALDSLRQSTSGSAEDFPFQGDFLIAGVQLHLATDDPLFLAEFERLFGCDPSPGTPLHSFRANVLAGSGELGTLTVDGDGLTDGASFLKGFASPTVPLVEIAALDGRRALALEGESQPLFVFHGGDCRFRKSGRWRRVLSHFLYLRMLRLRSDLLFFHAASLAIDGRGVLLVGPKGSGKTTLSSSVAIRGHEFLGDETAAYRAADGAILPMRRPISVKPGVRSRDVDASLAAHALSPDEDGILHVPSRTLFARAAHEAKLHAVVFLEGFAAAPSITKISAGRDELSAMQPIRSSSLDDAPSRHVFAMIRLLGSLNCYRLRAADPDETARLLIEVIQTHGHDRQEPG
jgi:hypothetical protein